MRASAARGARDDVDAVDASRAGVGLDQSGEHAQRRRLAGAVRTQQAGDRAVGGMKPMSATACTGALGAARTGNRFAARAPTNALASRSIAITALRRPVRPRALESQRPRNALRAARVDRGPSPRRRQHR